MELMWIWSKKSQFSLISTKMGICRRACSSHLRSSLLRLFFSLPPEVESASQLSVHSRNIWWILKYYSSFESYTHSNVFLMIHLTFVKGFLCKYIPFFIWNICNELVYSYLCQWSWNKTITAFAFVQYENLFALENS